MKPEECTGGLLVKMTEEYKQSMLMTSSEHIQEFGDCTGVVIGPVFHNGEGPEVDVRWYPSDLRYGYDPNDLEAIDLSKV